MMACSRFETDGMRYLDGEMSAEERLAFDGHCAGCDECREQLKQFRELDTMTRRITMKDPTDEFWERYWKSIYRRIERKTAWVLIIAGVAMLVAFALHEAIQSLRVITFEKIAVLLIAIGGVLLLISLIRERLHQYRVDPYRDVKR
jgi:anti-sigma factor RsiW